VATWFGLLKFRGNAWVIKGKIWIQSSAFQTKQGKKKTLGQRYPHFEIFN